MCSESTATMTMTIEEVAQAAAELENATPQEVLQWALNRFGDTLSLACSFSLEDLTVFDMLAKLTNHPRAFALDTGRLNPETYAVWGSVEKKYDTTLEAFFPDSTSVEAVVRSKGIDCFYDSVENRRLCCHVRKVEPLNRALGELSAWVTGLRREQAVTRTSLPKVEYDEKHGGIVKLNPLADWTQEQIMAYAIEQKIPRNALYDSGYTSIGCAPCTRAIKPGEDERAGRWWWENPETKECGLHA